MDDDTILIQEYEEITCPSERKREHVSDKIFNESKIKQFKDALGIYNSNKVNSPKKDSESNGDYEQLFTEVNDQIELNPKKLNFDTEAAETLNGVGKKSYDSQLDSARMKMKKEESTSNMPGLDSDCDSESSRYLPSRIGSTQLQHKKSDHWKKAKRALGALQFSKQISHQEEEKHHNIMQGSKKFMNKSRTIFLTRNSSVSFIWNTLIFLTILYYNIMAPYIFAFNSSNFEFGIIEIALDVIILFDIIFKLITFPSMRRHSDFKEHILKPYAKRFLAIDILCIVPLYFVDSRFLIIKVLRNFHLPRCFYSIRKFSFKVGGAKGYPFIDAAKMWLLLILAVHLLSCVWIFIGLENDDHPTWIDAYQAAYPNQDTHSNINYYINSFYFLVTTVTTVGFGGEYFVASNNLEMIICIFIILAGLVLVGFFQGKIEYMIQNNIEAKSTAAEVNDELERWLLTKEQLMMKNAGHVDQKGQELMNQILSYFKFYNSNNVQLNTSASEFFERIAPDLKDRVIHKSLHGIINKFDIFFANIKELSFEKEVILHLKPRS